MTSFAILYMLYFLLSVIWIVELIWDFEIRGSWVLNSLMLSDLFVSWKRSVELDINLIKIDDGCLKVFTYGDCRRPILSGLLYPFNFCWASGPFVSRFEFEPQTSSVLICRVFNLFFFYLIVCVDFLYLIISCQKCCVCFVSYHVFHIYLR